MKAMQEAANVIHLAVWTLNRHGAPQPRLVWQLIAERQHCWHGFIGGDHCRSRPFKNVELQCGLLPVMIGLLCHVVMCLDSHCRTISERGWPPVATGAARCILLQFERLVVVD